jgi:hypothetical protein
MDYIAGWHHDSTAGHTVYDNTMHTHRLHAGLQTEWYCHWQCRLQMVHSCLIVSWTRLLLAQQHLGFVQARHHAAFGNVHWQ